MLLGLIVSVVVGFLLILLLYNLAFSFIDKNNYGANGVMFLFVALTYLGAGLSTLIYFVLWIRILF